MRLAALAPDQNTKIAHIRKAVQADPTDTALKIDLAVNLKHQGKSQEAISVLKEAEATSTDPALTKVARKYVDYIDKHSVPSKPLDD
jgi:thioredoxin-like negative regulator of GroEL